MYCTERTFDCQMIPGREQPDGLIPLGLVLSVEDLGNRLVFEHGLQGGGHDGGDRQHGQPVSQHGRLLIGNREGVGGDDPLDRGLRQSLDCLVREHGVGGRRGSRRERRL